MKVIQFNEIGNDVLFIDEMSAGEPNKGEVRFKVEAFAINRADLLYFQGLHYSIPALPKARIGSEATGIVDAVGDGVTRFKIGDRVSSIPFHNNQYGVHGEFAIVPENFLAHCPVNLTSVESTSIWMQYLTAYFALAEVGKVGPDDNVLISAASSSAGLGALQLVKMLGAKAIVTTRTTEKRAALLAAGADAVIVTNDENIEQRILDVTDGKGVRIVYDAVGGNFMNCYLGALAYDSIIFLYGLLSGQQTIIDVVAFVQKSAILHPYSMFNHVIIPEQLERGIALITKGLSNGNLKPIIDKVFDLDDALESYKYMETGQQFGKIVVKIN